jgi:hypothetical protein
LGNFKIHCAIDNKRSEWRPLQAYFAGTFELGQSQQSQKNFECDNIVSLINLSNSRRWLYVGAYRVVRVRAATRWKGFIYTLTRIPGLEHLDGRAIIEFPKAFRASYLIGQEHRDSLVVSSIHEEKLSIADFPGFDSVCVSFEILTAIVRQDNSSWRSALANVAGVYVIVDSESGLQYVGSAYGGVGLWQRWAAYVHSGHGGNKELRDLLKKKGAGYAQNFQFSVLEVCDIKASPEYVRARECHWKMVLMTREFGLNRN